MSADCARPFMREWFVILLLELQCSHSKILDKNLPKEVKKYHLSCCFEEIAHVLSCVNICWLDDVSSSQASFYNLYSNLA